MATLVLPDNGQSLPLEDSIARDDNLLRQALAIVYPGVGNAEIKREEKEGQLIVTIVKQAGRKGSGVDSHTKAETGSEILRLSPCQVLRDAPEEINPALQMYWQLKLEQQQQGRFSLENGLAMQSRVRTALDTGRIEADKIKNITKSLRQIPASPGRVIPVGF